MDLEGKVIVITGGGQGLGFAMAKALGAKGARLALIDMNAETLEKAVGLLKELNIESGAFVANVTSESEVEDAFSRIVARFGRVDGLINNAGIIRDGMLVKVKDGEIQKMPFSRWESVIATNLTGTFLCAREAAAKMIEGDIKGVIINISSVARGGNFGQGNYSAAKAGVVAAAATWAKELAKYGIRCASIAPGFVMTEMVESVPKDALKAVEDAIPLGRLGRPEEIAQAAVSIFENDYFSGRVFEVDGAFRV